MATKKEADAFAHEGVGPGGIEAWKAQGFHGEWIRGYVAAGLVPTQAAEWRAHGFLGADALEATRSGLAPGTARSPGLAWPWTDAFRRSTFGTSVFTVRRRFQPGLEDRWEETVANLGAAHDVHLTVFGPRTEAWAFLDGGVVDHDPPYFTGLRGTWLVGYAAVRLMCARLGVRPPRTLKGEPPIPAASELERLWANQRLDEATLHAQLARLLSTGDEAELCRAAQEADRTHIATIDR